MFDRFKRLWQLKLWVDRYEKSLNRRADVENYLIRASKGKEPLPDKEMCAKLAAKLGVGHH